MKKKLKNGTIGLKVITKLAYQKERLDCDYVQMICKIVHTIYNASKLGKVHLLLKNAI